MRRGLRDAGLNGSGPRPAKPRRRPRRKADSDDRWDFAFPHVRDGLRDLDEAIVPESPPPRAHEPTLSVDEHDPTRSVEQEDPTLSVSEDELDFQRLFAERFERPPTPTMRFVRERCAELGWSPAAVYEREFAPLWRNRLQRTREAELVRLRLWRDREAASLGSDRRWDVQTALLRALVEEKLALLAEALDVHYGAGHAEWLATERDELG